MKENQYDNSIFFEQYGKMSRSVYGLKGAGEWHKLREFLPDLNGKRLLDLGCGYGWHCHYAADHGAAQVVGIDISEKMIGKARQINAHPLIDYRVCPIEDYEFQEDAFDIVLSSLTFHYLESFDWVCRQVHTSLCSGGSFIFSVEHPVFTAEGSEQWVIDSQGHILHWPVDHYFTEGSRASLFLGERVVKYHHTMTTYIGTLLDSGFELVHFAEPEPDPQLLDTVEGMKEELRRPMMLIIGSRKK